MSIARSIEELIEILDLEQIDLNFFRGVSPPGGWGRVFGGQVVAQALVAAQRTVEVGRTCHSLHSYFLRGGDPLTPILYEVVCSRDGGSFSSRRVIAIQKSKEIFHMAASFQVEEEGLEHATKMPDVPSPDSLLDENERRKKIASTMSEKLRSSFLHDHPIEIRSVDPPDYIDPEPMSTPQYLWFRATSKLPEDSNMHRYVLSYASDMSLLMTSLAPHGVNWTGGNVQLASLDHALWFHHDFRFDQWMLYVQDSPSASGGRGYSRGLIYTQEGLLVASAAQEGLMRVHDL